MIHNWTKEEATLLYQAISTLQNDVSVTRKRLEIVEQKPDYMIYIDKLQKQVKTLESARERQIKINTKLLKLEEPDDNQSWFTRLFK